MLERFTKIKEYFASAKISITEFQLEPHANIINVPLFINTSISYIEKNINKAMIIPCFERLEKFYMIISSDPAYSTIETTKSKPKTNPKKKKT